ncbi:unnamed protein product [Linum trigynum]|uniref:Uncharacterized protein n=1 Tax=Linum trigynum TaxID=586398 RepID=A0AAV2CZF4_9ROSI
MSATAKSWLPSSQPSLLRTIPTTRVAFASLMLPSFRNLRAHQRRREVESGGAGIRFRRLPVDEGNRYQYSRQRGEER